MPIRFEIDRLTGAAFCVASGELTLDTMKSAASEVWSRADFGGIWMLWDLTGAWFDLTAEEVREIAYAARSARRRDPPARTAFVVRGELEYGLTRMFAAIREQAGLEIGIFRDRSEALDWLRIGEDP